MKGQNRQGRVSLILRALGVRLALAAVVLGIFFSIAHLINCWYERSCTEPEQQIMVPLAGPSGDTSASDAREKLAAASDASDLTFFKSLTDTKISYPGTHPVSSKPTKHPAPASSPSISALNAPTPIPSPAPTTPDSQLGAVQGSLPTYAVQAGSFSSRSGAVSLQKELEETGFSPYISEARLGNGSLWYRVRVGKGLPRSQAEDLAEKLRARSKVKPFVVSEK